MLKVILSFVLASLPAQALAGQPQEPIRIHIDHMLWPEAAKIDWPGDERTIGVLFNAHAESRICGKPLGKLAAGELERSGIVFGVACGELFVLMTPMSIDFSAQELELIAAHEAIHSATLSMTRRVRLDIAGAGHEARGARKDEANDFFLQLMRAMNRGERTIVASCASLRDSYDGLGGSELAFVSDQINGEWPAEYFMRLYGSMVDDQQYAAFRRKISRGNDLEPSYMAGGIAMVRVDEVIGRRVWQRRAREGESITDLLFEALGCDVPSTMGRYPFASVRGVLPSLVVD